MATSNVDVYGVLSFSLEMTDPMLYGGDTRWNSGQPLGSAVSLSYSFMQAVPAYYAAGDISGFQTFTAAQKTAAQEVLAQFSEVANITFSQLADTGSGGQIRLGNSSQGSGQGGYAYTPVPTLESSGDVWINRDIAENLAPTKGLHEYTTLLHEIGHALGLKHPGNYSGSETGPFLPTAQDSTQYTVMSYNQHPNGLYRWVTITDTGGGQQASWELAHVTPETLMLYDIAAIQYLYGANTATRAGNDTYTFSNSEPFFKTIWDGGGVDRISITNYTRASSIDLRAGRFSSLSIPSQELPDWASDSTVPTYYGQNNLAIAFGVTIEHATGGSGHDTLIGNDVANSLSGVGGNDTLSGGAGNDILNGGSGLDRLVGGANNDTYFVDNVGDRVVESANQGSDTVKSSVNWTLAANIENLVLTGTANCNATGNGLSNRLTGNSAANLLKGMGGNDTLTGGDGADKFKFVSTGEGVDSLIDFVSGTDKIQVVSSNFGAIPTGLLNSARFLSTGTVLTSTNAVFLYDGGTGALSFDIDGNGVSSAVTIAILTGAKTLVAGDIQVVAT